ncbi:MAG: hypothetical protein ACR2M1_13495 [Gemmatimonadaceae bacterium]
MVICSGTPRRPSCRLPSAVGATPARLCATTHHVTVALLTRPGARPTQLGAERGLRVLMVAEGSPDTPVDGPDGLVAFGFLGISDPQRAGVPGAYTTATRLRT